MKHRKHRWLAGTLAIVFESGKVCPMQRGGFVSKTEAIKARENTIKQLHEKTFVPFEYTAREFFDYWLYYYMIDEADIAYNTYTAYRNIIYNYFLVVWGIKKSQLYKEMI